MSKMQIKIDSKSGFCFGVVNAIKIAEKELEKHGTLYCLGEIVHNEKEVERLKAKGLLVISHQDFEGLYNTRVLIRAHGEPPKTYRIARENNIELIDASCPVVLKLQNKIKTTYEHDNQEQIIIFGKEGHAEVVGLKGQTENKAIVINSDFSRLDSLDFSKPIKLYSQTTQDIDRYLQLISEIKTRIKQGGLKHIDSFQYFDSICRQVSHRGPQLKEFAQKHDVIVFVSGKNSSNGKYLFGICKDANPNTFFVSCKEDIERKWFKKAETIGICGATSTPMWLMEEMAHHLESF